MRNKLAALAAAAGVLLVASSALAYMPYRPLIGWYGFVTTYQTAYGEQRYTVFHPNYRPSDGVYVVYYGRLGDGIPPAPGWQTGWGNGAYLADPYQYYGPGYPVGR